MKPNHSEQDKPTAGEVLAVIKSAPFPNQPFLKACPFCGSESIRPESLGDGTFVVDCQQCGAGCGARGTQPESIEEWNQRDNRFAPSPSATEDKCADLKHLAEDELHDKFHVTIRDGRVASTYGVISRAIDEAVRRTRVETIKSLVSPEAYKLFESRQSDPWISVKDRLPKVGDGNSHGQVLLCFPDHSMVMKRICDVDEEEYPDCKWLTPPKP